MPQKNLHGHCRKSPLKLVHVGKFYPPHMGGMETHLQDLVRGQCNYADIKVIVAADTPRKQVEYMDGASIVRIPTFATLASMPITPTLGWELGKSSPDLLHIHAPNPGAAFSTVLSRFNGPLVITHHSDTLGRKWLRKASDPFVQGVMKRAKRIIVTSRRYLESSTELRPYFSKCIVVPLGIDPGKYTDTRDDDVRCLREVFGSRIILAVGRLVSYKGLPHLIGAMPRVAANLLIVGDGPLDRELKQLARDCGVSQKVHFMGRVESVGPYYRAASVLALPSISRAEAFGLVQLEAMASGIPVINTDIDSGVPEVSLNGVTGITVPPGDSSALANALNLLLDDDALRSRFGAAAQERVRREFSLDLMVERILAVYGSILEDERGVPAAESSGALRKWGALRSNLPEPEASQLANTCTPPLLEDKLATSFVESEGPRK